MTIYSGYTHPDIFSAEVCCLYYGWGSVLQLETGSDGLAERLPFLLQPLEDAETSDLETARSGPSIPCDVGGVEREEDFLRVGDTFGLFVCLIFVIKFKKVLNLQNVED